MVLRALNEDNREKKGKEDLSKQREKGEEGTKQWDAESERGRE